MRDLLTVLAGLVLLVLFAALAVPAMLDWNQQRPLIEAQLKAAAGVDVVTTGPIKLRLLPSPRLAIGGVRVGEADPQRSRLTAERLVAEMDLAPLLRAQLRINSMSLDGMTLTIAADGRGVIPPEGFGQSLAAGGVGRLTVTRGLLRVTDAAGQEQAALPLALEASLPGAGAPWRAEGEIARRSFRLITGDADRQGRTRLRLNLSDGPMRSEFDGWLGLTRSAALMQPDAQGALQLTWPSQGDNPPHLTVSAQLTVTPQSARLTGLAIESPGAGKLEGEAELDGPSPSLSLRARRFDLSAWQERQAGMPDLAGLLLDRFARIDLGAEQIAWRGEEASDVEARLLRRGGVWRLAGGQARFAGASATARAEGEGAGEALRLGFASPDLRRVALALQRLGLPESTAADLGTLGDVTGDALLTWTPEGWRAPNWTLKGRFGQAQGSAAAIGGGMRLSTEVAGADLLALMRPASALAMLAAGDLSIDATAREARLGASPPGRAAVSLTRRGGAWSLASLSANGFDGVMLTAARATPAAPLGLSLSAQRADAVAAALERLTDQPGAARLLRALRGVSPLNAAGEVTPHGAGFAMRLEGQAGPMRFTGAAEADAKGALRAGDVTLSANDRALLFRALGLPAPGVNAPTRLVMRSDAQGAQVALSGDDGLNAEARIGADGGPLPVSFRGPLSGLAPGLFGPLPGATVSGRASLRLQEGVARIDDIRAELGGAEGAGSPITGALIVHGPSRIEGRLTLPAVDAARLALPLAGRAPITDRTGAWSGERWPEPPAPLDLALELESRAVTLPIFGVFGGSARLAIDAAGLRLSDIKLSQGASTITGSLEADRSGGQIALRGALGARGLNLAALGPDFAGAADITTQFGAFGESPARLAASLNGAGEVTLRNAALLRFEPAALERIAAANMTEIVAVEAAALAQNVRRTIEAGAWTLADRTASVLIAGGVARLGVFLDDKPGATGAFSGLWDARSGQGELRAAAAMKSAPRGWTGAPPQLALNWRGPWRQMQRAYDLSALANTLSQRALQREIERVEAFEAEIRQRMEANQRLREEEARREEERREEARQEEARREDARREEEARRAAEQQPPQQGQQQTPQPMAAPPLPPPVTINPVPAPLSRQPARAN